MFYRSSKNHHIHEDSVITTLNDSALLHSNHFLKFPAHKNGTSHTLLSFDFPQCNKVYL